MEVMFYIIAGKFNPSNDDFPVKTLITKDKFADNLKMCGDGAIILRCCADWMVDIKTPDSSNSVDDVALLIKNAIERAIDGSEISVKYKVLY